MEAARTAQAIDLALAGGWLRPSIQAGDLGRTLLVHDLDAVDFRVAELRAAFPTSTLHAIAIKANPVGGLLDHLVGLGCGLEAASRAELRLALDRLPPDRIVWDAPARTLDELRLAVASGVHLNLDRLDELDRLKAVLGGSTPRGVVGLRVNPGVGPGRVQATSTAVAGSKFGADLANEEAAILTAFAETPWLSALHVHVGSTGMSVEQLAQGAAAIVGLADRIEAAGGRVDCLDLGGGVPSEEAGPDFSALARALGDACPGLLGGGRRLITEMGRSIHAAAGLALSRVEAVRRTGGRRLATIHLGADLFVRAVYRPAWWRHRITVHAPDGSPLQGPKAPWDVVGPLCFSGDRLAKGLLLPELHEGDIVAIHDVGAYTLSMWSRYNSRPAPAVLGLRGDRAVLLKPEEEEGEILRFWGA